MKENKPVDLLWRRLGNAHDRLVDDILRYAHNDLDEIAFPIAAGEFLLWPDAESLEEELQDHLQLFMPWFVFNWVYDPDDTDVDLNVPAHKTIAELYAAHKGKKLDTLQHRLIDAACSQPYSFYEVVRCRPGEGYRLRDIFQGIEIDVLERQGSETAKPGNILLGRVVQVDHVAMLMGCGSILIPPRFKPSIISLRQMIKEDYNPITSDALFDYDFEIRELYFDIYDSLLLPPQLHNTDGDPLLFHTLHYSIDDPERAFEALCGLSVTETPESLRQTATLDENGCVIKAEIPWTRAGHKANKSLSNTVLGRMLIDNRKLSVEVNSEARAKRIKKEIKKRLGPGAAYQTTKIRSQEDMMTDIDDPTGNGMETGLSQDELMEIPEVREQMENFMVFHWRDWVDQKIPALGGKTPRKAVKTKDGRESVEALLKDAEQSMTADKVMGVFGTGIIDGVRQELGLDRASGTRKGKDGEKASEERIDTIKRMIEDFGSAYLNPQYTAFVDNLCDRIAETPTLNIQRGRVEIWAAAMVYVIARLNFLFDPESDAPITPDTICGHFNTVKSTVASKATLIQDACDLDWGAKDFCRRDIIDAFAFVETPEGFILPKSVLDQEIAGQYVDGGKAETLERFTAGLKPEKQKEAESKRGMKTERNRKVAEKEMRKQKADDKQRSLFDDF